MKDRNKIRDAVIAIVFGVFVVTGVALGFSPGLPENQANSAGASVAASLVGDRLYSSVVGSAPGQGTVPVKVGDSRTLRVGTSNYTVTPGGPVQFVVRYMPTSVAEAAANAGVIGKNSYVVGDAAAEMNFIQNNSKIFCTGTAQTGTAKWSLTYTNCTGKFLDYGKLTLFVQYPGTPSGELISLADASSGFLVYSATADLSGASIGIAPGGYARGILAGQTYNSSVTVTNKGNQSLKDGIASVEVSECGVVNGATKCTPYTKVKDVNPFGVGSNSSTAIPFSYKTTYNNGVVYARVTVSGSNILATNYIVTDQTLLTGIPKATAPVSFTTLIATHY